MTNFFNELQAYLEHFAMIKEKLLICGDFNLYLELSNDANTIKFNDILNTLDLQQGVTYNKVFSRMSISLSLTEFIQAFIDVTSLLVMPVL